MWWVAPLFIIQASWEMPESWEREEWENELVKSIPIITFEKENLQSLSNGRAK